MSGFSTAIRMHQCPWEQTNLPARKQIISAHIFLGATYWIILNSIKLITYYLIFRFSRRLSLVQSLAPRRIRAEIICLRVNLLVLGVIHACQWDDWSPPKLRLWLECFCAEGCVWLRTAVTRLTKLTKESSCLRFFYNVVILVVIKEICSVIIGSGFFEEKEMETQ